MIYVFWVKTVERSSCGRKTRLFNSFRIATKEGKDVVCLACYTVQRVDEGSNEVTCFACRTKFKPKEGFASGGKFRCEHCGREGKTVGWVRRTGRAPGYEMFAIEYWCQQCCEKVRRQGYNHNQAKIKREATRVLRNLTEISTAEVLVPTLEVKEISATRKMGKLATREGCK
jgi:adenine-specific DNA methylase